MKFDYIVVGAGFAGATIAERIANQLDKKVLVIEKRDHIGGNAYDFRTEEGIIVHKYGPHIFHTKYKEVWEYVSRFTDWIPYVHKVLAYIDGKKVPLPFNFRSIDMLFSEKVATKFKDKLVKNFGYGRKVPILELRKTGDPDLRSLADFIYDKVFLNYTIKQWGVKPEELDPSVTARVPVSVSYDDRYFDDPFQGIPKEGYSKIFERMLKNNENVFIELNVDCKEVLEITEEGILFDGKTFKGTLIYTGPIDYLFDYRFGRLPYRTLDFEFEKLEQEYYQERAVVNYPNDFDYTRITEYKHFNEVKVEKTIIAKEFPRECSQEDEPYYPFLSRKYMEIYKRYELLADKIENLILLGRLAEYRYYDMDDIVKRALKVFKERIK